MLNNIEITPEDILYQIKISCTIPEVIQQITIRKVIEDAIAEAGIEVEIKELQLAADQTRIANKLLSADQTWTWLKKYTLSLEDFEQIVYNRLVSGKLANHLFANQVEPHFYANQMDYTGIVMYEVILNDEDLALELYYAIKEGEISFYDVAHKYIQDTELRRHGGYQGIVYRKDLAPEVSAAVFANKAPQLLKPIVTSKGFHLILIEEIIQPELDDKLRSQILMDLFYQWTEQRVSKVEVVNKLDAN